LARREQNGRVAGGAAVEDRESRPAVSACLGSLGRERSSDCVSMIAVASGPALVDSCTVFAFSEQVDSHMGIR